MQFLVLKAYKVSKGAKIRNRYNQVPHLTQDTNGKVTNSQLDTTNESQEVSPFSRTSGRNKFYIVAFRIQNRKKRQESSTFKQFSPVKNACHTLLRKPIFGFGS